MMHYAGGILAGILVSVLYKSYLNSQFKAKISDYKKDIAKSHNRIIRLEERNKHLKKRLEKFETPFSVDKLFLN
jgi:predicted RNase H-like nuclease (RuvC/YqgF family)